VLRRINTYLMQRVMNKYRNHSTWKKATRMLTEAAERRPRYFAHWAWVKPAAR
jgi:hypothetical protein